jgi:hypothetical protein
MKKFNNHSAFKKFGSIQTNLDINKVKPTIIELPEIEVNNMIETNELHEIQLDAIYNKDEIIPDIKTIDEKPIDKTKEFVKAVNQIIKDKKVKNSGWS